MTSEFTLVKISSVAKIYSGNSINEKIKSERYSNIEEGIHYISTKDIYYNSEINYDNGVKIPISDISDFKIAPANTVFICAEGGSAGRKIAISNKELCFVNKLFAIVADKCVLPKYLFYALKSSIFANQFRSAMTGIIGGVSLKKFKELEIPLPNLEIQKQIICKLDEVCKSLDQAIQLVELNIDNADALFKSYLSQILFHDGDANWSQATLDSLCLKGRDITYGVIKLGDHTEGGIPCLRTSNVRWLRVETNDMKSISKEISKEYSRTILQGNEVLVNVRGTLGGVCVVDSSMKGWNISREVAMVPSDSNFINPKFLAYTVASNSSQQWLSSVKKGAAYVGINLEDLRGLTINYPSLSEQDSIVENLTIFESFIKSLEAMYKEKLSELMTFKQCVIDDSLKYSEV